MGYHNIIPGTGGTIFLYNHTYTTSSSVLQYYDYQMNDFFKPIYVSRFAATINNTCCINHFELNKENACIIRGNNNWYHKVNFVTFADGVGFKISWRHRYSHIEWCASRCNIGTDFGVTAWNATTNALRMYRTRMYEFIVWMRNSRVAFKMRQTLYT